MFEIWEGRKSGRTTKALRECLQHAFDGKYALFYTGSRISMLDARTRVEKMVPGIHRHYIRPYTWRFGEGIFKIAGKFHHEDSIGIRNAEIILDHAYWEVSKGTQEEKDRYELFIRSHYGKRA